jgi:putative DNA primase/helicase
LLARLDNVKALPSGYSARCPAHDDHVSSLMVNEGKRQPIVLICHAGCPTEAIVKALGLEMVDLMGKPTVTASYEYRRADGTTAYIVDRWTNPKTFRVRGHLPPPAERVLYQLPAITWARSAGAVVHVVEGEKDVDRLIALGHVATTNVSGAGSWLGHYGESLAGCHVTVWADNDAPGRLHARQVAANVTAYAASVTLVVPRHGKDVSELLDAGYGLDAADPLAETDDVAAYVASTVRTRRVEWAWRAVIPLGKLTIIEGDPGDGKSILTVDLAARWSAGNVMPDGSTSGGPWPVFMVSAEDDVEDTIVPRLIGAGAKLDNVWLFPHGATPELPFEFATDLAALERHALEVGAKVIVFDPLPAFMSLSTDTNNDMNVRKALYPLRMLAIRTGAAVIVVRHLNKGGSGTKAVYRGNGSIAFTGAARVSYLVTPEPNDPSMRLLACVKNNIGPKAPTFRYSIDATPEGIPFLLWHGVAEISAQDALDGPQREAFTETDATNTRRKLHTYAMDFLRDALKDGPRAWHELVDEGKADGFTEHQLRNARADLGLMKVFGVEGNRDVRWALTTGAEPETGSDNTPVVDPTCPFAVPPDPLVGDLKNVANGQVGDGPTSTAEQTARPTCEVCGTSVDVLVFEEPWNTARCFDHDPRESEAA